MLNILCAHLSNYIFTRHDDLKQMLDSAKDGPKLEAMKRIIGVIYIIKLQLGHDNRTLIT